MRLVLFVLACAMYSYPQPPPPALTPEQKVEILQLLVENQAAASEVDRAQIMLLQAMRKQELASGKLTARIAQIQPAGWVLGKELQWVKAATPVATQPAKEQPK